MALPSSIIMYQGPEQAKRGYISSTPATPRTWHRSFDNRSVPRIKNPSLVSYSLLGPSLSTVASKHLYSQEAVASSQRKRQSSHQSREKRLLVERRRRAGQTRVQPDNQLDVILDEAVEKVQKTNGTTFPETFNPGPPPTLISPVRYHTTYDLDERSRVGPEDDTRVSTNAFESAEPGASKPSDSLRLYVPPDGRVYLDSTLTVSFNEPTHVLQDQVKVLQSRLSSSYPRVDDMPFDVWRSSNRQTLQTWLKILISRWQARLGEPNLVDEGVQAANDQVKTVLDQMVRDHDLSNAAAHRMAQRWSEIFKKRSSEPLAAQLKEDSELDWDEMEVGGLGFLRDEAEQHNIEPQPKSVAATSWGPPTTPFISKQQRFYITSSRPPINPDNMKPSDPDSKCTTSPSTPTPSLPHLTPTGTAHMVSVSAKPHTTRTAIAAGTVYFSNPTPLTLIRSNALKKGDVLSVSRIAGITAAKKCPDLIPLCHPIALTHVGVELATFDGSKDSRSMSAGGSESSTSPPPLREPSGSKQPAFGGIHVEAKVECTGPTGVEMEALTSVMGAALSVLDMCKAVDKGMWISNVRVVLKEGGRSGTWREEGWRSFQE